MKFAQLHIRGENSDPTSSKKFNKLFSSYSNKNVPEILGDFLENFLKLFVDSRNRSTICNAEFFDRVDGDMVMSFGGLHGRGRKKQDPAIERELALSLEEVFHGCTKKMKISRRVRKRTFITF